MKIGILGGTGNISTPITKLLLEMGHEVVCCNRGQRGEIPNGAKLLVVDRKERTAFEEAMQAQHFDAAIDMICFNAEDAASSIRAFRGVKHFVHCSTVCTYGVQYDWFPTGEDHPLRPISDYGRGKVAADNTLLAAYHAEDFPVTIIKPSTTYGPRMGALRQIAWEFSWIDRVKKGKPIIICDSGVAFHQLLHVEDAAPAFACAIGRERCVGQVYNMTADGFTTWADYHRTANRVIGNDVELVSVPLPVLKALDIPNGGLLFDIFAHPTYYSNARLKRDVPEFAPRISLADGLGRVIEAMAAEGRIPDSDALAWEDTIIQAQRQVCQVSI